LKSKKLQLVGHTERRKKNAERFIADH
jgi:hypothetical protein